MDEQLELDLLKDDLTSFKCRKLEWSYSKRSVLEQCLRKYYYHYYGSNSRTAKTESFKEKQRTLKSLSNRFLRTGYIFHLVISVYIKKYCNGEIWDLNRLLKWAEDIYNKDIDYSQKSTEREFSNHQPYPPVFLLEFYYNYSNVDKLVSDSKERLLNAINNFFKNKEIMSLLATCKNLHFEVEKSVKLDVDGSKTSGKIDFLNYEEKLLKIYDWKIGKSNDVNESLQLMYYAIWAVKNFNVNISNISIFKTNTLENEIIQFNVTTEDTKKANIRIFQDLEKIQLLDNYGSKAEIEAFNPSCHKSICALCQYQEICS